MIGDRSARPITQRRTWKRWDATLSAGPGATGTSPTTTAERPRLTLMSRAPATQIGGVHRRSQAPGRRGHVPERSVRPGPLVPQREDQEPPQVPAVVPPELRVVPDHLLDVGGIEEPLLAEALLRQDVADVLGQLAAEPRRHRHVEAALLPVEDLARQPVRH